MTALCPHGRPAETGQPWPGGWLDQPPDRCRVCYARLVLKPQRAARAKRVLVPKACPVPRARRTKVVVKPPRKGLGDFVAWFLKLFGITPKWWSKVMGGKCNCRSRQARLNRWGWRVADRVTKLFGRR